jgi:inorganic pyrophosphatase
MIRLSFLLAFTLSAMGCKQEVGNSGGLGDLVSFKKEKIGLELLPAITEKGINAVIEIPAGTNHKAEYDYESGEFVVETRNGKKRVVDFLPYVGNYGFVPSTYMDPALGGDGDAIDILVISETVPSGTVMEVIPIAALELMDNNEIDTKLIAVPVDTSLRVMHATDFMTFTIKYNAAQQIIENWFLNYKGLGGCLSSKKAKGLTIRKGKTNNV